MDFPSENVFKTTWSRVIERISDDIEIEICRGLWIRRASLFVVSREGAIQYVCLDISLDLRAELFFQTEQSTILVGICFLNDQEEV